MCGMRRGQRNTAKPEVSIGSAGISAVCGSSISNNTPRFLQERLI